MQKPDWVTVIWSVWTAFLVLLLIYVFVIE